MTWAETWQEAKEELPQVDSNYENFKQQVGPLELAVSQVRMAAERDYFPYVVEQIVIENDEQLKNASDLLAVGKRLEKDAEQRLAAITKPIREQEQAARDAFKPLISRIHLGWSRVDDAIIQYHRKVKAEADALLQMQAIEQAQKIAEAKETGEVVDPVRAVTQPVGQTVKGNQGTTNIRETPEFLVIDEQALPRECLSPDLKKIKAYYQLRKDIPGVLVTMKSHTVSRFS